MKTRASTTAVANRSARILKSTARTTPRAAGQKTSPSLKFKNILVPFDFSKPAERALRYAIGLAKQFEGQLTLVYIVEPPAFADFDTNPLIMDNDAAVMKAKEKLSRVREQQGKDAEYIAEIKVNVGKPFHEIAALARGLRQDVIVIATHGRTALKHVLMGSTAEKVVRHAPCPVLVIREK